MGWMGHEKERFCQGETGGSKEGPVWKTLCDGMIVLGDGLEEEFVNVVTFGVLESQRMVDLEPSGEGRFSCGGVI